LTNIYKFYTIKLQIEGERLHSFNW